MAANFTSATPSFDAGLTAWANSGGMARLFASRVGGTTAANPTSGYISASRFPTPLAMPAPGAGVRGGICTLADFACTRSVPAFLCLEYLLGTLTLSGNSFSAGVSMPAKTIYGTSIQTASALTFLVATTAGTATPTITITYTNQDGTTGQTATLALPANPSVNSAFLMNPHLATGDSGVRAVTNMSSSVNSGTLVLSAYGCLVLAANPAAGSGSMGSAEPLLTPAQVPYLCESGENINIYKFDNAATDVVAALAFCPEPT